MEEALKGAFRTCEDVRAKLLDLSANKAIAGNSKTSYRIQRIERFLRVPRQ